MKKKPRYLKQSKARKKVSVVTIQLYIILALMLILIAMCTAVVVMDLDEEPAQVSLETVTTEYTVSYSADQDKPTEQTEIPVASETEEIYSVMETTAASEYADPTDQTDRVLLPYLKEYYDQNQDIVGWIEIENTKLDYPLMYTPDDPEKYLHLDFDEEYSYGGLPFIDANCLLTPESDNLIIYGHNMLDGSMFRTLMKYDEKSYWEEHPVIRLDLIDEEREYEIIAAFYDRVYYTYETCFKFYKFIEAEDQEKFDEAMAYYKSNSLYDTGVTAEMGDRLITLVTCAYHVDNGRFVVVARERVE